MSHTTVPPFPGFALAPAGAIPPAALAKFLAQGEVTSINRLPGRATFQHYAVKAEARKRARTHRWHQSLDGAWDFRLAPTLGDALGSLGGSAPWAEQQVPGHWVLQGYGNPHYTNTQLPFGEDPPQPPAENPTGIYRKCFSVPKTWDGKRVVVRFGSADSALILFLNGAFFGLSKDSRLPAEFDLSERLKAGENEIVAVVPKWSDATFVEDQDMWWLPGLARSVTLFATPRVFLADVKIDAQVERSGKGRLRVEAAIGFADGPQQGAQVEVQVWGPDGKAVLAKPQTAEVESRNLRIILDRNLGVVEMVVPKGRMKLWSAETPNLYTVVVTLRAGNAVSHTAIRTGFRRIEVVGRNFLLNGERVLIAGVNRHEFHPRRGRALTDADMETDIKLMKRYHFNAVRASHYPPDERWLDLCDEHGLMVVDEANIETHHHHNQVCKDPRYATTFVDRVSRMVLRDKNHPSILWWSMGNESGYGPNHDAAAGWVRHYDPTRPLFYEGAISVRQSRSTFAHGSRATDIICPMYTEIADLRKWTDYVTKSALRADEFDGEKVLREVEALNPELTSPLPRAPLSRSPDPRDRPVILCEYSHAMGNSNGSLGDYFELFRTVPGIQGGFIWEWCDHAFFQTMPDGSERLAYGGDYGDVPHDANFCCDGLVSSEREPHPAMAEHRKLAQPVAVEAINLKAGKLRVKNRQNFRSLAWLKGEYRWEKDGEIVSAGGLPKLVAAPGDSMVVTVPVPAARLVSGGTELVLAVVFRSTETTAWWPAGEEIAWEQFGRELKPTRATVARREGSWGCEVEGDDWVVANGTGTARIDRQTGAWHTFTQGGGNVFADAPQLSLWRAPTDNDGIKLWEGQDEKALGRWRKLGVDKLRRRIEGVKLVRWKNEIEVVTKVSLSGRDCWTDFRGTERFVFGPNSVCLDLDLVIGAPQLRDLPRIGFLLSLTAGFEQVAWHGLGPDETYSDRCAAGRVGRWQSTVAEMEVPYVLPQEHGHRHGVRAVELQDGAGRVVRIKSDERFGFNASHFHANDLYRATHREALVARPETLLHVDGFHRGLGTGSCGPDTLPPYCWSARRAKYSFELEVR